MFKTLTTKLVDLFWTVNDFCAMETDPVIRDRWESETYSGKF